MQIGGNDLLSIAKRLRGYADRPGTDPQKQSDLLVAADVLALFSAMPRVAAPLSKEREPRIPG